jgi:hypothetical protein
MHVCRQRGHPVGMFENGVANRCRKFTIGYAIYNYLGWYFVPVKAHTPKLLRVTRAAHDPLFFRFSSDLRYLVMQVFTLHGAYKRGGVPRETALFALA